MYFFEETTPNKLTRKGKLKIWAMLFIGVPVLAYAYGKHEWKHSDQRRMSMLVNIALPAQLPEFSEF